jgi:hypothetical protein
MTMPSHPLADYFGQPSGGFFFCSDCLTAFFQFPRILSTSGLGPGADFGLLGCFGTDGLFAI